MLVTVCCRRVLISVRQDKQTEREGIEDIRERE